MSDEGYGIVIDGEISESDDDDDDDAQFPNAMPVVVAGEDSESEEEMEEEGERKNERAEVEEEKRENDVIEAEIGKVDDLDLFDLEDEEEALQGIIVTGEASESEEEWMEEKYEETAVASKESVVDVGKDVIAVAPGRDKDGAPTTGIASQQQPKPAPDSVLHHKLAETNQTLNHSIKSHWQKLLKTTTKDVVSISQSFQRTRQVTQESSHTMRLLTNNLFKMEDSVDIVSSCNLLPKINI